MKENHKFLIVCRGLHPLLQSAFIWALTEVNIISLTSLRWGMEGPQLDCIF